MLGLVRLPNGAPASLVARRGCLTHFQVLGDIRQKLYFRTLALFFFSPNFFFWRQRKEKTAKKAHCFELEESLGAECTQLRSNVF